MNIRELTQQEFYEKIFPLLSTAFEDTFSYSVFDVRTENELSQFSRLRDSHLKRELIYLGVFDESGNIAGYSISYQARIYELYTQTSVVLPQFRRQGIYTAMTKKILEMAREKGYQMVTSNHVTSNNPVIMAKLKLDFKISGFEIYDDFGGLVKLTYFLNEKRAKMFDVRTGFVRPDAEQKALLKI